MSTWLCGLISYGPLWFIIMSVLGVARGIPRFTVDFNCKCKFFGKIFTKKYFGNILNFFTKYANKYILHPSYIACEDFMTLRKVPVAL